MIVDLALSPFLAAVEFLVGLLPTGQALPIGPVASVWSAVAQFDSFIPVMGPLVAMLGVLSAVAVFIVVRLVLTVWNLIYP